MNDAVTIFLAGIGGVFTGIAMLYLAILFIIKCSSWRHFTKDSK